MIDQPVMGQVTVDTLVKLWHEIQNADLVVHLVGDAPGTTANPRCVTDFFRRGVSQDDFLAAATFAEARGLLGDFSRTTYTQWEAWLGLHDQHHGTRQNGVLVYVPQDDFVTDDDGKPMIRDDFPQEAAEWSVL